MSWHLWCWMYSHVSRQKQKFVNGWVGCRRPGPATGDRGFNLDRVGIFQTWVVGTIEISRTLMLSWDFFSTVFKVIETNGGILSLPSLNIESNFRYYKVIIKIIMNKNRTTFSVPMEMSILIKEHFNRWYSLKAYYVSVNLLDIPVAVSGGSMRGPFLLNKNGNILRSTGANF